jgi:ABC-2 type transport system permease protein
VVLFGFRISGSVPAYVVVLSCFGILQICLALLVLTLCKTVAQINAATYVGPLLLAVIGGAVTPVELLPGWVAPIARWTPAYWAMDALNGISDGGWSFGDIHKPIAVLLGYALVALLVARRRFSLEQTKISWV